MSLAPTEGVGGVPVQVDVEVGQVGGEGGHLPLHSHHPAQRGDRDPCHLVQVQEQVPVQVQEQVPGLGPRR